MTKAPETLSIGETVKLRGREPFGTLVAVNRRGWAEVSWSRQSPKGPGIVGIGELERVPPLGRFVYDVTQPNLGLGFTVTKVKL